LEALSQLYSHFRLLSRIETGTWLSGHVVGLLERMPKVIVGKQGFNSLAESNQKTLKIGIDSFPA